MAGMEKQLFQLKFTAKQLARSAKKAEKDEKTERTKLYKAMQKGNMDGARIYAQNAIRKKNEQLNFLRLSAKVDAVATRVETAVKMKQITGAMGNVVKQLEKASQSMNLEEMSKVMDKFEEQFENLDVQAEYVGEAMAATTATTTPVDQVESLMAQVAEEHGLDVAAELSRNAAPAQGSSSQVEEKDDLAARLQKLQAP